MPFFDYNLTLPPPDAITADFTIVGAGAAGIFMAVKLAAAGRRVLLLETGHFVSDDERQSLNQIVQTGKPLSNPVWNRQRVLGGTTTIWGGQSLPFSPLDFAVRPWVPDSGWPIAYGDLAPHYPAANAFMRVDGWNYDTDLFAPLDRPNPGFDPAVLIYHFSKWAPEPDFLKLHRHSLAREVTVLHNAHLTRIDRAADGRVSAIAIANFHGRTETIATRHLILSAGGIETNRILLQNDHQAPGGLGNHAGWLGRSFMEHPSLTIGEIISTDTFALQAVFATRLRRFRKYSVRLSTSEGWQRARQLLNASATVMFLPTHVALPSRPPESRLPPWLARMTDFTQTAAVLAARGFVYRPHTRAVLSIMVEQAPTPESTVTLDSETDRFGLRRARLHWKITEPTWRTALQFTRELKSEIERLGLGSVHLLPGIRSDNPDWSCGFCDVNHHMGGTRMSATADEGVVTRDLQVWHVPNLHVCSSSVFPTTSHSNPTLTLLALCDRLVARLTSSR